MQREKQRQHEEAEFFWTHDSCSVRGQWALCVELRHCTSGAATSHTTKSVVVSTAKSSKFGTIS